MGKPIFSKQVITPTRLYYVDVNEDSKGGRYMTVREIPSSRIPANGKTKKPQRIFFHSKAWKDIAEALTTASQYLSDGCKSNEESQKMFTNVSKC